MISAVQMPLPIRAAIAPSDWPQRCAPSPESLMTSIDVFVRVTRVFRGSGVGEGAMSIEGVCGRVYRAVQDLSAELRLPRGVATRMRAKLLFRQVDSEELCRIGFALATSKSRMPR